MAAGALNGRLSLVTGAASGIGKAVCELFAKEGATVIGLGLNDTCDSIKDLPNNGFMPHSYYDCDVSNESSVKSVFEQVLKDYQQTPTIAVNSAGITKDNLMIKITEQDFDDVINVNLKGTFFVTKYLCGLIVKNKSIKEASIVNIASIVGKTGNMGQANYTASKAGVVGLTKTTALEFARFGVRCNAILPGFITTAMTEKVPQPIRDQVKKMIPLNEFGKPEDIAEACLYLASNKSRYVTGTTLEVAGGLGM